MCGTCGCNVPHADSQLPESVVVLKGLLDDNDHQAAHNRAHFERARHTGHQPDVISRCGQDGIA